MKNISTIIATIALALGLVLLVLHFTNKDEINKVASVVEGDGAGFRIAHFDIDSLQQHYEYYKVSLEEMKQKESVAANELQEMKDRFQRRIKQLQDREKTMTYAEVEAAQREVAQMDQNYRTREQQLMEKLQSEQVEVMKELRTQIESYLAEYNKDNKYAYIISYEPSYIVYYKDAAYDITNDLIKGLNTKYPPKAKK